MPPKNNKKQKLPKTLTLQQRKIELEKKSTDLQQRLAQINQAREVVHTEILKINGEYRLLIELIKEGKG